MSEGKIIDFKTHLNIKKTTKGFCLHKYVEIDEENDKGFKGLPSELEQKLKESNFTKDQI